MELGQIHAVRDDFAVLGILDDITRLALGERGSHLLMPVEIPLAPVAIAFAVLVLALNVEEILHRTPLGVFAVTNSLLHVPPQASSPLAYHAVSVPVWGLSWPAAQ